MTILHDAVRNGDKERVISILSADPSSTNQKENGYTPAHLACRIGDVEIVKELIKRGADVKTASENGYTPFHTACRFGHVEIVKELIERGADVKAARPDNWSPLHSATWACHPKVVDVLLKNQVDPDKQNSDGWNALHLASFANNDEIVEYLLHRDADVCIKSMTGETALDIAMKRDPTSKVTELLKMQMILKAKWTQLHIACYHGHSESVLDILKNGSSADECNKEGCTALHLACEKGHHKIVEMLLKYHARVDIKDKEERTPLHTASHYGHIDVVKLLIFESKTDTNIVDKNGDTAVGIALRNKHYEVAQFLEDHDESTRLLTAIRCNDYQAVKDLLLHLNTDSINYRARFGYTALHYASRQGYKNIVRMLMDKDADVDIARNDGWTALQSASSLGYTEVVCLLLCKSQSVNIKNEDGMTALHYACKYGHYEIVDHLICHDANITMRDFDSMTALHYAQKYGHHEIVQLLKTALMKSLCGRAPSPGAHSHAPNVSPDAIPSPDAHPENMATLTPSPDPDDCRCFTIINGKAGVFDCEEYGLTISFPSDCLPSNIKKCKLLISADLTTDIPLPSGSLLVSGVYHITTTPFIDQLNQPIEITMEHCAKDFNHLCFVVAKECRQQHFEYMEGGKFEIDSKSGRRIGRICVSSFSFYTTVKQFMHQAWEFLVNMLYCGRIYYDDTTFSYRNIHFVITKQLLLAKDLIAFEIPCKVGGDLPIEFSSDRQVHLDLPKGIIGEGWKLVPFREPTIIKQQEVDVFSRRKRLPQCEFSAQWTRDDITPTIHNEKISLFGTKERQSITVVCVPVLSLREQVVNSEVFLSNSELREQVVNSEGLLVCSEEDIYTIVEYDFNWKRVGRRLLSDQTVQDIDHGGGTEPEKKETMLLEWKKTKSYDATYQALVNALKAIKNQYTADCVEELERKSKTARK